MEQPGGHRGGFDELPEDALLLVFTRLKVPDLGKCCCVNRHWRRVATNKRLWIDMDLSSLSAQRVTHQVLITLAARAQGELLFIRTPSEASTSAWSEVTLATLLDKAPQLICITGAVGHLRAWAVAHALGANSAEQLIEAHLQGVRESRDVQKLLDAETSPEPFQKLCLFLQLVSGPPYTSLKVLSGILLRMRIHRDNFRVQLMALHALHARLGSLKVTSEESESLSRFLRMVFACVGAAQTHFSDDVHMAEAAVAVLCHVQHLRYAYAVQGQGPIGFNFVITVMQRFANHEMVQQRACSFLQQVRFDRVSNADSAGAIDALVATMNTHLTSSVVQESACLILSRICRGNVANTQKAGQAGAIEAVIAGMKMCGDTAAFGLNEAFCALHSMLTDAGNRQRAGRAGAIDALLDSRFSSRRNHSWFLAFTLLVQHRENHAKAVSAGAVRAIISHASLNQECAFSALLHLFSNPTMRITEGSEALALVVKAMRRFAHCDSLQKLGCDTLCAIVTRRDQPRLTGVSSAVKAVVNALKKHLRDADVQKSGCLALTSLMSTPIIRGKAAKHGALEAILSSMCRHKTDASVQTSAFGSLLAMTQDHADNKRLAGSSDAVFAVVGAMLEHTSDESVQHAGSCVLTNLAEGPRCADAISNVDAALRRQTLAVFQPGWNTRLDEALPEVGRNILARLHGKQGESYLL